MLGDVFAGNHNGIWVASHGRGIEPESKPYILGSSHDHGHCLGLKVDLKLDRCANGRVSFTGVEVRCGTRPTILFTCGQFIESGYSRVFVIDERATAGVVRICNGLVSLGLLDGIGHSVETLLSSCDLLSTLSLGDS